MSNIVKAAVLTTALLLTSGLEGKLSAQEPSKPQETTETEESEEPDTATFEMPDISGVTAAPEPPISYRPSVNTQALVDSLKPRLYRIARDRLSISRPGNVLLSAGRIDNIDLRGGIVYFKVDADTTKVHTQYTQGLIVAKDSIIASPYSTNTTLVSSLSSENPKMAFLPYDSTMSIDALASSIYNKINMVKDVKRKIDMLRGIMTPYPDPFNPQTTITLDLPYDCRLVMTLHNILGQAILKITDDNYQKGRKEFRLDLSGYSSGIYFIKAQGISTSSENAFITVAKAAKVN
jgi:hypothetical protein